MTKVTYWTGQKEFDSKRIEIIDTFDCKKFTDKELKNSLVTFKSLYKHTWLKATKIRIEAIKEEIKNRQS